MRTSHPCFFGTLAVFFLLGGMPSAQQLAWHTAIGENGGGESEFVAVEAMPESGDGQPAKAWYAGNFEGEFKFEGLADDDEASPSGMVVRMSENEYDLWGADWKATAVSDDGVRFTDLAISNGGGLVYVCGSFDGVVEFIDAAGSLAHSVSLSSEEDQCGFVAVLEGETGIWLRAYTTWTIQPVSLVAEDDGEVYITGPGTLASKFAMDGSFLWFKPPLTNPTRWAHVAIGPDPSDPNLYVLCEDEGDEASQTVVLWQLSRIDGTAGWTRRMGSSGVDAAGGLDVGPKGDVRLSYSADDLVPLFMGQPVEGVPTGDEAEVAENTIVARVRPDGTTAWVKPVGQAPSWGSKMRSYDIDIDPVGNAWLAVEVDKAYEISDKWVGFAADTIALVCVDAVGAVHDLHNTFGKDPKLGLAVAVPARDLVISAGRYTGKKTLFEGLPALPNPGSDPGAYAAILKPVSEQQHWAFRAVLDVEDPLSIDQLRKLLRNQSIKVYGEFGTDADGTVLTGYATNEQVSVIAENESITISLEPEMTANGTVVDAGWALAKLGSIKAGTPWTYTYPETANDVVLYLIDTAVANPGGWFDKNPNLTIGESILIRGTGDPEESSEFGHGTRMLSLIAGPETGAAQGTPIRVVNYDIYPDGTTTTASLVAKAVLEAAKRHQQDNSGARGVICLATSSQSQGTSMTLQMAVDYAVAAGLPVVVSAGNSGEDASAFIPASYGSQGGVICVGAVDSDHQRTAISNFGTAVDLYAPGENVNVIRFDAPASGAYDLSHGTSPATALTAAAALVELSQETTWRPEEVEKVLYDGAYAVSATIGNTLAMFFVQMGPYGSSGGGGGNPVTKTPFEEWAEQQGIETPDPVADSDGDGTVDLLEFVHGGDPLAKEEPGRSIRYASDSPEISYEFVITPDLFDEKNPQTLLDGTGWEIQCSDDMVSWETVSGELKFSATGDGRVLVRVAVLPDTAQCFLRILLTPGG